MDLATVDTPLLRIAYTAAGPEHGMPMVLLHGWPDDASTWDRVLPDLHLAGFRTYVPFLRGCGPTRFLSDATPRSGQLVAMAKDALEFAEALGLKKFSLVGHDWGARAAYVASVVAPEKITACVAISVGWGTNDPAQKLSLKQTQNYWYHWLMATERGARIVREDRKSFTRYIWTIWNPGWSFPEEEFLATQASFENPDWAEITLHSYRVRWDHAPRDPASDFFEARVASGPIIQIPTLTLHGGADPVNDPSTSEGKEKLFQNKYQRHVLEGLGHFPQRQDPQRVAREIIKFLIPETS